MTAKFKTEKTKDTKESPIEKEETAASKEEVQEEQVEVNKEKEEKKSETKEIKIDPEEFIKQQQLIEKLEKENMEYRDKLIRKIAEFENYKKRTSDEFLRLISTANEDLILKLLPVIDDMERFQNNTNLETKSDDLRKGMDLITDKFNTIIKNLGLKEIEVIGEEFDPNLHEALMQMESEKIKPNHIIDQHEKGYKLKDKVIRHSKVLVAK